MSDFLGCRVINEYNWKFDRKDIDKVFDILDKSTEDGCCRVAIRWWRYHSEENVWSIGFTGLIDEVKLIQRELREAGIYNYNVRYVED